MSRGAWHDGERRAQERAGVAERMARAGSPGPAISAAAAAFLAERTWVIAAYADPAGAPRIAALSGEPGFITASAPEEIRIDAPDLPLGAGASIGLLAIEPATRRRMKAKGIVTAREGGTLVIRTRSVYALCPKHITPRPASLATHVPGATTTGGLSPVQRAFLARADTFFLATHSPAGGADASHRGGDPGFLTVIDDRTIAFTDYAGNNMFNTMGNLDVDPRIALLVSDFETGRSFTVSGRADVTWTDGGRGVTVRIGSVENGSFAE